MTFICWTDEFITSLVMSINGNWNYSSFHIELLLISAFPLLAFSHRFLSLWLQHPMLCIHLNFHSSKLCRTARTPISAWACAKQYFPVVHLQPSIWSHGLRDQRETATVAALFPCLLLATEDDVRAKLIPLQYAWLRETVLKCPCVLEWLCSHKWNAPTGHTGFIWLFWSHPLRNSGLPRDISTNYHLTNNQPHKDPMWGELHKMATAVPQTDTKGKDLELCVKCWIQIQFSSTHSVNPAVLVQVRIQRHSKPEQNSAISHQLHPEDK